MLNNTQVQVTAEQLETFRAALQEKLQTLHATNFPGLAEVTAVKVELGEGSKYVRVANCEVSIKTGAPNTRSAYCFIDRSNGDILKAAGWKAPAKHARGNIRNGVKDCGAYGVAYLR